jgi:diguanylate cyclase
MVGNITVSLGVATHCPGEALEAFMRRADEALYESKRGGRNRVTVAEPPPLVAVSRAA